MKDLMDGEKHGAMLKVLKELLASSRSGMKDKLPKKGISVTEISVLKPKESKTAEDVQMENTEAPESMEMPEEAPEEPMTAEESAEEEQAEPKPEMEASEESPEHEASESLEEEDSEHSFGEPKIPADVMELVKMMLMAKARKKDDDELS